jgi:hypothetical protein
MKKRWAKSWSESERGQKIARIDKSSRQSAARTSAREAASQFRLTHAPVNHHLKRIQKIDSARCPACGASDETIQHFLLSCPSYAPERWALAQAAKKKKRLSMETLLGDREMIIPLASHIDVTHRSKKNGEQNNPAMLHHPMQNQAGATRTQVLRQPIHPKNSLKLPPITSTRTLVTAVALTTKLK